MIVDAHQHFWNLDRMPQPWMQAEHAAIARSFEPSDLAPLLATCGVEQTIVVQGACLDSDTDALFDYAADAPWIAAVVAWVDLEHPERARARLTELASQPQLRGIRHLIHEEPDPHWVLRPRVLESLALVADAGLVLELPAVFPRHLGDVPELASRLPGLTIVIDHLGKPPIGADDMSVWATELRAAASWPNVAAKISGLNTALHRPDWQAEDLVEAVAVTVDCFGAERLLCGSDWPVALLNGTYERVWAETARVIELVAPKDAERMLAGTARSLYRLDDAHAVPAHDAGAADGRAH